MVMLRRATSTGVWESLRDAVSLVFTDGGDDDGGEITRLLDVEGPERDARARIIGALAIIAHCRDLSVVMVNDGHVDDETKEADDDPGGEPQHYKDLCDDDDDDDDDDEKRGRTMLMIFDKFKLELKPKDGTSSGERLEQSQRRRFSLPFLDEEIKWIGWPHPNVSRRCGGINSSASMNHQFAKLWMLVFVIHELDETIPRVLASIDKFNRVCSVAAACRARR